MKKVVIEWEVGSLVGALAWCERLGAGDRRDMPAALEEQRSCSLASTTTIPDLTLQETKGIP